MDFDGLKCAELAGIDSAPVSVVIPCYCCGETIERAVASVENQSIKVSEIIIVDDASPDDTPEVLRKIKDSRPSEAIRLFRLEKNSGPSCARNIGWEMARFPYIAFLDSDDSWHERKIEIQYGWMAARPNVAITGHHCMVVGEEFSNRNPNMETEIKSERVSPQKLLFSNAFSTPSVMLRRDVPYRFSTGQRYSEDYRLWCTMICAGLRGYNIRLTLAYLHKPRYGYSGLSSNLWAMEKSELQNYVHLYRERLIPFLFVVPLMGWSLIKHLKRLITIHRLRRNFHHPSVGIRAGQRNPPAREGDVKC